MFSVLLMATLSGAGSAPACDNLPMNNGPANARPFSPFSCPVYISYGMPILISSSEDCDDDQDSKEDKKSDRKRSRGSRPEGGATDGGLATKVDVLAEKVERLAGLLNLKMKMIED